MRQIDLISKSDSIKYLLFGLNADELSDFSIQLWITKTGARAVDWMQSLGMGFITFMGGDLWIHNDATVKRCNLFGEQKDCVIGVVGNENATTIKVYDVLGVHSDGKWEVIEVTIPESLSYPNGMYSKIPKEQFMKRSGVWRAKFLRNMKTNQSTASVLDALNGEPLKGYECYMLLKNVSNPSGAQVKLFKVDVSTSLARV